MMNGTHGAPSPTSPVSLIFCRPTVKINQPGVQQTVTPFEQIGGIPGFIAMLVIGVGLMGGYIYLASKNNKK
jgi:hypothetical protein